MSFSKKTVRDVRLTGKTVLVSVDYNVPGDTQGQITNSYRLQASVPTIKYLMQNDCRIVLISHRGRPEGRAMAQYSLKPVAIALEHLIKRDVAFAQDCIGKLAEAAKERLQSGDILLLENTRFHPGEEANDAEFAKQLAAGADVFVQDAFGNAHRKHASTDGVAGLLPAVAGLLLEKEVNAITSVMQDPQRPLMAIIGGAKISDKLDVLNRFIDVADFVAVGGAMANTFLLAEGVETGKSLTEPDDVPLAKRILERARTKAKKQQFIFYLPQDGVVAKRSDKTAPTRIVDWSTHVIADVEHYPKQPPRSASKINQDEMILDIGPFSGAFIAGGMQLANTVIWNGAMGVTETPALVGPVGPFAHGTELIVDAMTGQFGNRPFTLVGGGDTVGYIESRGEVKFFDHVSTGGGASLELMSGKALPAVEALLNKNRQSSQPQVK